MRKLDIVKKISTNCEIDKKDVSTVIDNFMIEIKNSIIGGENVYLRGFGTFKLKKRAKKLQGIFLNKKPLWSLST